MKELIIVETENSQKIKAFLDQEQENYKVYQEPANENEEQIWRRAVRLASQDEQRKKEISAWDKIASQVKE